MAYAAKGLIFIYPTDTVYGIGCNALIEKSVAKIRRIKRTRHAFSVIAPSKAWIKKNLVVRKGHEKYIALLPGKYTLILRKKDRNFLKGASSSGKLGIRMPENTFCKMLMREALPFVTTSANLSGEKPITSIEGLAEALKGADFAVDGGKLKGKASTVIDLTSEKPVILRK